MLKYIILIIALSLSFSLQAQFIEDEEPEYASDTLPKLRDKLFFGGNIGLTFGSYTYINVSPIIGYRIFPQLSGGVGVIFEYMKDNRYANYSFETTIYGGKIFLQSVLFKYLILYVEDNILSLERKYYDAVHNYPNDGRFTLNVPWIGGGFYQKAGRGGMYFMILFNLNNSSNSPYSSYEYRIGFNF
jgi:hypothetical protein